MTILLLLAILLLPSVVTASPIEQYVQSEPQAISAMIDVAHLSNQDTVYDLGSGDGRIVIAAARRGANAVGIEINPKLVKQSRASIREQGLTRARIVEGDFFKVSLRPASIVMFFLSYPIATMLEPRLRSLKPMTRVISNGTLIGNWKPDVTIDIGQMLCNKQKTCVDAPLYLWRVR